jgi:hypothetical protein
MRVCVNIWATNVGENVKVMLTCPNTKAFIVDIRKSDLLRSQNGYSRLFDLRKHERVSDKD